MRDFALYKGSDQQKIDQISVSVKKLLAITKKLKAMNEKWAYTSALYPFPESDRSRDNKSSLESVFALLDSWKKRDSLIDEQVSIELRDYDCFDKDKFYRESHQPVVNWQRGTSLCPSNISVNLWINGQTKVELTEQLDAICRELLSIDPESLEIKTLIQVIRRQLHLYSDTENTVYLLRAFDAYDTFYTISDEERHVNTHTLREHKKKLSISQRRDLRQCYRRLIRFLFKNLDADDDDSVYLSLLTSKHISIISRHLQHENKINTYKVPKRTRSRSGDLRKA